MEEVDTMTNEAAHPDAPNRHLHEQTAASEGNSCDCTSRKPAQSHLRPRERTRAEENFADILSDFERSHTHKPEGGATQLEGTGDLAFR